MAFVIGCLQYLQMLWSSGSSSGLPVGKFARSRSESGVTIGGEGVDEEPAAVAVAVASRTASCFARSFQFEEFCMEVEERFLGGLSLVIGVVSSEGVKRDRTEEA